MRELSEAVREASQGAVGASRTARRLRVAAEVLLFAVGVSVFLAFVGAFGSDRAPPVARYGAFILLGLICTGAAWAAVSASLKVRALEGRPWLRQAALVAVITPATGISAWIVIGLAFLGGLRPELLPGFLATGFGMTIAMTALSWAVFRRGRSAAAAAAAPGAEPVPAIRFLERLPANLKGAAVLAVQAEDHYVRVHTDRGSALILMRLADAATELEGLEGARVHRSWWVARAAVAGRARRGAQTVLQLAGGVEAPVSRAQVAELKRAGWF